MAADLVAAGATPEAAAIVAAAEVSIGSRLKAPHGSENLELAGATLGIAALGQFAVPALVPVSAALLVGTNLKTFHAAWQNARQRKIGLPALSTTIVATTMVSGQFVGAAIMSCFTAYWNRRARLDLDERRRHLIEDCLPTAPLVRLLDGPAGGTEILVPPDQIREGNRIVVSAGEAIPADGLLIDGSLVVDERSLRGLDGASRKGQGDPVLAGSTVLAGSARVRVERTGDATRGAIIAKALTSATSPARGGSAPTRHAEAFATRTVGPVLATSGLGFLLLGDPITALAMMRPDYATGVGISVPMATLRDVATCARRGIVIRDPEAFDKLDRVDAIILDDQPALRRTRLEVAGIETRMPADVEPELLRYAASALRHLDDPRVPALATACRAREVPLFDLQPAELADRGVGVSIVHSHRKIRVHEADPAIEEALEEAGIATGPDPAERGARPLLVEINGDVVALISFRPSERLEGAEAIRRLTSTRRVPVILATDRPRAEVSALAASLGVNQVRADLTPSAKAELVRSYRLRGLKAAFVGDCSDHAVSPAAAEAFIAISIPRARLSTAEARAYPSPSSEQRSQFRSRSRNKKRGGSQPMAPSVRSFATDPLHPSGTSDRDEAFLISDPGPASVQILSDRLDRLELLWDIAGARSRRIRRDQTVIAVPNVFAAAGALLFGFTSYHSILLTNLGTYTAYHLAKGPNQPRETLALASPQGRSASRGITKN
jgi:cation transport ATPase